MLTLEELTPFLLSRGTERSCYRSPYEKDCIIKLSPASNTRQTRREVSYFRFLQKKKVPFLHIPEFKGVIELEGYTGFKQEAILDEDGQPSLSLRVFIAGRTAGRDEVFALLDELYQYLLRYNILPCDLHPDNILVQRRAGRLRLVLIDGLGSMNLINFNQYVPFLGRKQITRKWRRFIKRDIAPCFAKN